MITLVFAMKDLEEDPIVMNFLEDDWEFSIRLGSTLSNNDNFLTIANPNRHFSDSDDVVSLYNTLKLINPTDIDYVLLKVNNVEMFNSSDFNFFYKGLFLQYQYVNILSNVDRDSRGNAGLNIFINFSNFNQVTTDIEDVTLGDNGEGEG